MQHLLVSVRVGPNQALPIEIYTPEGSLIDSGAVSSNQSKLFDLPMRQNGDDDRIFERVYVFAKLPGGATIQEVADLDVWGGKVVLDVAKSSPYEWLEWVTPFRSLSHLSNKNIQETTGLSIYQSRRIGKVWATLWEFREKSWGAKNVNFERLKGDRGVLQLTLDVPCCPHLLQLGGEELSWRMISLPPGKRVNIALTPRMHETRGDALDITVGQEQRENELIMSYLSQGCLPEVTKLAELMEISDRLLFDKFNDPISAVAGGYVLLKTNKLEERESWLDNLNSHFPYIADIKILKAALAREKEGILEKDIRQMLLDSMEVGLPIFSLGITLLHDGMAAMHRGADETRNFHRAFLAVQAYVRAGFSKGAYFAFYGKSPAEPLWIPIYGTEQAGAATPVSLGSSPPVFMGRPKGSPRSVRYGETSVTLPSAPVSMMTLDVIDEYNKKQLDHVESGHRLNTLDLPEFILKQTRISVTSALPSRVLKRLPDYLVVPEPNESLSDIVVSKGPQSKSSLPPERKGKAKSIRNAKDWKSARISHSILVMNEDD